MTENTERKSWTSGRHWTIALVTALLVTGGINYFVQDWGPGSLFFGVLAGALAWLVAKPRRA